MKGPGGAETGGPGREPARDAPELESDPELQALHRELSEIRIEERPSFGPELEKELERRWRHGRRRAARPARRTLALAAGVVLLLTGLSVPPARGALVRLIQATVDLAPEPGPEATTDQRPTRTVVPPASVEEEAAAEAVPESPASRAPEPPVAEEGLPREEVTVYPVRSVPPEIWDRAASRQVVSRFYPPELAAEEIGGVVGLLIYVDSEGRPAQFRVSRSSGLAELDGAALMAAPRLRFLPARRNGEPVGTWVAFDVRFDPNELHPDLSGLLVVAPGQEIVPMALAAAMPLPEVLPGPPAGGTVGILVKIDELPTERERVEIRVVLERGQGVRQERTPAPFRLQGEEAFRRSAEVPVERVRDGVLYLTADLRGLEPGRYDAWIQLHLPARGDVLEASAPVTVR